MTTVFIISAPSGSGKSTLVSRLLAGVPGLLFSVSYTTRALRGHEVDGQSYRFVRREDFERMIAGDEFLEWAQVFGNYYGTHRGILEKAQATAALVLYGVSALTASLAVLQTILHPRMATVLLLLLVAAAYVGFRSLRYTEFGVLNQFLFAGDFRRVLRTKIHLKEYQQSIACASTVPECWAVLRNACREAGFTYVAMRAGGQFFEDETKPAQLAPPLWCVQVPLGGSDFVVFRQDPRLTELALLIVPFVDRKSVV